MEEAVSTGAAFSRSPQTYELLILHTAEGEEWAAYLQQILQSSPSFQKETSRGSTLLYAVTAADQLHGYNFEDFQSCSCIVLLLTSVFLDFLCDHELQAALLRLLYPPHRVVAFLCGVSEDDILAKSFGDWPSWRKLTADDEPAVYISTILEAITDSKRTEIVCDVKAAAVEPFDTAAHSTGNPNCDETEEVVTEEKNKCVLKDEEPVNIYTLTNEIPPSVELTCLTIQPNRILCGEKEKLFIILTTKLDCKSLLEVEFSSEGVEAKRVSGTLENECTISVIPPDLPAGLISLSLHTQRSSINLGSVTFYTRMGEVSRHLEEASDPLDFICQAFKLAQNSTDALDTFLTDSVKSKMPPDGLQMFGVKQIEEDDMSAYQRKEEFPTLLHFAANYGLQKLSKLLLKCPGALQACSVMNKNGDYPNTLAEKSGFMTLRHLIDKFVTADMDKSILEDAVNTENDGEIYELMSTSSQDILTKLEDIYEPMVELDQQCEDDLYEEMFAPDENSEEVMLRKFFQGKTNPTEKLDNLDFDHEEEEKQESCNLEEIAEEDPYNLCLEDIYNTVDANSTYNSAVLNRPPAPMPRSETESIPEKNMNYITRVFTEKTNTSERGSSAAGPSFQPPVSVYDPYSGMKTPGQRQLICLQEKVKLGEITVDEAVQEFKSWQFDHNKRACSLRYQQDNLKKLRESITRRHKEREKFGKELDLEISAPMERNIYWGSTMSIECAVYETSTRMMAAPAPVQSIHRGNWKTGSTSSTSSTESNRLSTHSYSSGTDHEYEDTVEVLPLPPRPPRPSNPVPVTPPPRIPPRIPERVPEEQNNRYISCPTRALPQRPSDRNADAPPPVPRRLR